VAIIGPKFVLLQMARRDVRPSLVPDEDDKDFWKRDICKLFESDLHLQVTVCKLFCKVEGGLGMYHLTFHRLFLLILPC